MPKTRYIHIGFPKNMSTSLQRDYFSQNPDLYHLGVGHDNHNLGYIDKTIETACELYLRFAKDAIYEPKSGEIKDGFQKHFDMAEEDDRYKAIGISNEHMSFNFTPDGIDSQAKADRLYQIFGADTKIIMVIRSQDSLIMSLYRESLRIGYTESFNAYISYLYHYHDRNYVSDLFYDQAYKTYCERFGKENVLVIPIEKTRDKNEHLITNTNGLPRITNEISDHIGVANIDQDLGHYNKALSLSVLKQLLELNNINRHGLGRSIYATAEPHRTIAYFGGQLDSAPPEATEDRIKKWQNIRIAEVQSEHGLSEINLNTSQTTWQRLIDLFRNHNNNLENITGLNLKSLNYPF